MQTMVKMNFKVEVAKDVGVNAAIIYENICFWIQKNYANQKDKEKQSSFHDNRWWTFNSVKAFTLLFSWLSDRQIQGCLIKLKEKGYIFTGNYNKVKYDKTTWYAISDKAFNEMVKPIYAFGVIEEPKEVDRVNQSVEPIPDSNTNYNLDFNIYKNRNPIINKKEVKEKEENNEEKTNNEREINNLPYKKEEVINKQVVEEEPDCLSNSGDAQSFLAKKARNAVKRKLKQEYGGIIPPFVNQEEEIKKAGVPSTPSLTVTQTYQVPKSQEFADLLKWMREIKRPASFLPETEDNFLRIRQTFQLAEIKAAIKIALLDDFWKNQFNLNTFLRPSNYKGQPQDNVATFYSRRADNDPQIFAIKQEMKGELEKLAELENNAD